jgi:WD40 repeat protein
LNTVGDKPDPTKLREVGRISHKRGLLNCRFDDEGERLWTGSEDNALHRWDWIGGGHEVFAGHKSWVGSLAFLGAGHPVVTGGYEGQLLFWDAVNGKGAPVRTIDAHKGFLRSIAISPDGQWIVTGGNDKLARVWKGADGTLAAELTGHASHVYSVAFSRDGKRLISGDLKGVVKDWEVGSWKHVRDIDAAVLTKYDAGFQADVGGVRCVDFSPDGKLLALGGIGEVSNAFAGVGKPIITLIDWETGKSLRVLEPADAFQGSVYGLRFSKDGDFLVGAGGGGSAGAVWFWRPGEVKSFHMLKVEQVCRDLAMHPDGLRLAVPCFDNSLRLYDMTPTP